MLARVATSSQRGPNGRLEVSGGIWTSQIGMQRPGLQTNGQRLKRLGLTRVRSARGRGAAARRRSGYAADVVDVVVRRDEVVEVCEGEVLWEPDEPDAGELDPDEPVADELEPEEEPD